MQSTVWTLRQLHIKTKAPIRALFLIYFPPFSPHQEQNNKIISRIINIKDSILCGRPQIPLRPLEEP